MPTHRLKRPVKDTECADECMENLGQEDIQGPRRGEAEMHHPEEQQGLVEHELRDLGSEESEGMNFFSGLLASHDLITY